MGQLLFANIILIILLWGIAAMILYTIIRIAVRNGVREANESIERRLDGITTLLQALVKEEYKDQ
ncbi:MAG TPA: hypothetical protein GX523_09140 [Desulfitobacterium dehalogenans]|uniref:DUF4083 domain-containing protein n=1 Tax=Desulfitobacterium dehalogenans TaxID=36854 RepID=A0A7C6Z4A9_9FIRM|nr:hypothetical protein [Desulfitobacterium dehalogenans]